MTTSSPYRFAPPPVDYTDWDYATARDRLIQLLQSVFPTLDVESAAELATLLLESEAWVLDYLGFYIRNLGRESRFGTAQQRENLVSLCKLIGYVPRGAVAARWTETFTITPAATADINIAAGAVVRTGSSVTPILFELLAPVTIPAGQTTVSGAVENSISQTDVFTSTSLANQRFRLSMTPYLDGSLAIVAANGTFTQVANFFASLPTDLVFTVSTDQFDRATVVFGNGILGAIPLGNMTASYKTGGGTDGNVSAGAITETDAIFIDVTGKRVSLAVTNTVRTVAGVVRETVEQIRVNAPASVTAPGNRTVTETDFEINLVRYAPGIARALCLTNARDPSVAENTSNCYIVLEDASDPTTDQLAQAKGIFIGVAGQPLPVAPCLQTLRVNVFGASYLTVDVQTTIFLRAGFAPATAKANIQAALMAYFAVRIAAGKQAGVLNPDINFGFYIQDKDGNPTLLLAWSDIFDAIDEAAGVLRVSPANDGLILNGERGDVVLTRKDFPRLGAVTVIDGSSGLTL